MSPRQKLTEVRRRQILAAAGLVIADRGICETRIADIAAEVGVSPALILYYFPSKERLLMEALAHEEEKFFADVEGRMAALPSAQERLMVVIDASCPNVSEANDVEYVLWLEIWTRSRHDPELAEARRVMDQQWRHLIQTVVESGQESGEFSPLVDAGDFSLRLAALIDGLAVQVVLGDPEVSTERMKRVCTTMAATELGFDAPVPA